MWESLITIEDTGEQPYLNLCFLFRKQGKSEGDPLYCDRAAAQCSV